MEKEVIENPNENCDFCKIIAKNLPAYTVYESDTVIAFLDIDPIHEGHVLVVPKIHADSIEALPEQVLLDVMKVAKSIVGALGEIYNNEGYSIMQNGGKFYDLGHAHFHVFPRYENDGFGWTYPDCESGYSAEVAEKIRAKLDW